MSDESGLDEADEHVDDRADKHDHHDQADHEHADHEHADHEHADHGDHDHADHGDHEHHDHGDHGQHDHADHEHHHHDVSEVGVAIVTVSSTRSIDGDTSGDYIKQAFEEAGHDVIDRELIPDDFDRIQHIVNRLIHRADTGVVVTTGGTGVTPDDVTPEAVIPLLNKQLPGFGELFRRLSYEEVGTRTIGSRAVAGVGNETLVFCLPGSVNAARLGVEEVILPEIGHLVGLASSEE